MKKIIAGVLVAGMVAGVFSGCGITQIDDETIESRINDAVSGAEDAISRAEDIDIDDEALESRINDVVSSVKGLDIDEEAVKSSVKDAISRLKDTGIGEDQINKILSKSRQSALVGEKFVGKIEVLDNQGNLVNTLLAEFDGFNEALLVNKWELVEKESIEGLETKNQFVFYNRKDSVELLRVITHKDSDIIIVDIPVEDDDNVLPEDFLNMTARVPAEAIAYLEGWV